MLICAIWDYGLLYFFLGSTAAHIVPPHLLSWRLHCYKCQIRLHEILDVSVRLKSSLMLECRWRINPKLSLLLFKFTRGLHNSTIWTMPIYRKDRGKKTFLLQFLYFWALCWERGLKWETCIQIYVNLNCTYLFHLKSDKAEGMWGTMFHTKPVSYKILIASQIYKQPEES